MKNIHPLPVLANQTKKISMQKLTPVIKLLICLSASGEYPPLQAKNNLKN